MIVSTLQYSPVVSSIVFYGLVMYLAPPSWYTLLCCFRFLPTFPVDFSLFLLMWKLKFYKLKKKQQNGTLYTYIWMQICVSWRWWCKSNCLYRWKKTVKLGCRRTDQVAIRDVHLNPCTCHYTLCNVHLHALWTCPPSKGSPWRQPIFFFFFFLSTLLLLEDAHWKLRYRVHALIVSYCNSFLL